MRSSFAVMLSGCFIMRRFFLVVILLPSVGRLSAWLTVAAGGFHRTVVELGCCACSRTLSDGLGLPWTATPWLDAQLVSKATDGTTRQPGGEGDVCELRPFVESLRLGRAYNFCESSHYSSCPLIQGLSGNQRTIFYSSESMVCSAECFFCM